jgi:hypothetical protein
MVPCSLSQEYPSIVAVKVSQARRERKRVLIQISNGRLAAPMQVVGAEHFAILSSGFAYSLAFFIPCWKMTTGAEFNGEEKQSGGGHLCRSNKFGKPFTGERTRLRFPPMRWRRRLDASTSPWRPYDPGCWAGSTQRLRARGSFDR